MGDIGKRAVQAIGIRAILNGTQKGEELKKVGLSWEHAHHWSSGKTDPSAYFLQLLALAGYDVYWILTGKEGKDGKAD